MFRISLLMVGFAAHVLSEPIRHCDYNTSIDISQGTHLYNGDIIFSGQMYTLHEYFFDKKTETKRGCICGKKICIRKCCPRGQGYVDQERCVNVNNSFDPPVRDDYEELKGIDVSRFHLYFGKVCEDAVRAEVSQLSKNLHYLQSNPLRYCIDTFITQDPETKKDITRLDVFICSVSANLLSRPEKDYYTSCLGMLISCVFFIITIAVYAWVPELQNLHGCVLMVYLACLCVGFAFLSTAQIMKTANNVTANVCLGFTILIYFALLSAFFWLNVMCFDIWWTFSGKRGLSLENRSVRMRFCAYAAYAFGFPTALTVLLAALEFNDLSEYLVMPMVREQGCYFYETCRIYLYGPFVILCIANLVFFILTAWKINQIKKQTQKTLKSENSCITDQQRTDRQRFLLYVKLFTIMGINWILEIFSALYPQADNVWRFTDAYNTMTGFYIFVIFVCKKKILCLIKKRYHQLRGHSMSGTQTTSTKTLSSARDHGSQGMGMEPVKNNTQV